jgi:hypothetical protein
MMRAIMVLSLVAFGLACSGQLTPNAKVGGACKSKGAYGPKTGSNCARGLLCRSGKCVKDKMFYPVKG